MWEEPGTVRSDGYPRSEVLLGPELYGASVYLNDYKTNVLIPSSPVCITAVFEGRTLCEAVSTTGVVERVDLMTVLLSATYACCYKGCCCRRNVHCDDNFENDRL